MRSLAPEGPVYQAGTLSGNPLAVAAGIAMLEAIEADPPYASLERLAERLCDGLREAADGSGRAVRIHREGSLFSIFFAGEDVTDFAGAQRQDKDAYARFFHAMLDRGFWLAPSAFEAWFVGAAHSDADVVATIEAAKEAFAASA
jgi:glutamate-1-semialdehyde 2,1-aminomutase